MQLSKPRLWTSAFLLTSAICLLSNLALLPPTKADSTATPTPLLPSQVPLNLPAITTANAQSLKEIARFCGGGNTGNCGYISAWSPDSKQFAASSTTSTDIFDIYHLNQSPKHIPTPDGHPRQFSPDWTLIASINGDEKSFNTWSVSVWDVKTAKEKFTIPLPNTETLQFNPNGQSLALLTNDNSLHLWEVKTVQELHVWKGEYKGSNLGAFFSPDGSTIAITSGAAPASSIQLWNIQTNQAITNIKIEGIISNLTFSPDGSMFAVTSSTNTTVWNARNYKKLFTLSMTFKYDWALGAAFSPDSKLLGISGRQRIYVWNIATQKQSTLIDGLGVDGVSMRFGTDSSLLISTDNSDTDFLPHVRLWDTHTGKNLGDFTNEDYPVLSPDGTLLATYSHDGSGAIVIRAVQ